MRQALQAVTVGDQRSPTRAAPSRRIVIGGLGASAAGAVTGCGSPAPAPDGRRVLAAGQPAAVLVYALAPKLLAGWPRRPTTDGLAALDPDADLPEIGALTTGGRPADLESLAALRPRLIVDYGDLGDEHAALARRLESRLGAPWLSLDGALERTPQALIRAGEAMDVAKLGRRLGDAAERALSRWRTAPPGPSFYYARGGDGLETAFAGALGGEVLEGAGWTNLAVGGRDIGRVSREQVAAWDPEAVVTLDRSLADRMAADPFWRRRRGGGARRILWIPDAPFGWIDRPPSINRLLGCLWTAEASADQIRTLSKLMFRGPGPRRMPQWIE